MKKALWISIGLLIMAQPLFAAEPTMQYTLQPAGTVSSLPTPLSIRNLAPVPQNLCGAIVSAGAESATCGGLPLCKGTETKTASFSCEVTTNCGSAVSGNSNCTVSLNITKPASVPASTAFSFKLSYGSYDAVLASNAFTLNGTNPLPPAGSYRTITFKNSCDNTVWFGSITGAAPTKNVLSGGSIDCTGGDPGKQACVAAGGACYSRINAADACLSQSCSSDSDCVKGASCYAATGKCFWNNATPMNQSFQLTTGATNTINIPEYADNEIGVVWSGAFGGRTGCTTGACTSALCTLGTENAQGVCSLGAGFQQPATQAEPTFITYATGTTPVAPTDAYDVTVINGANVPMSMYPTSGVNPPAGSPYTCGAPGYYEDVPSPAVLDQTIGASSWEVASNQNNVAFRYVVPSTATPTYCTDDNDCASVDYCGLSYGSQSIGSTAAPGAGRLVCGTFAGWFTADQICGTNNSFTEALGKDGTTAVKNFQCNTDVALGKMSNLYQCNGNYAVSCYNSASADCCGCVNWSTQGTTVLVPKAPIVTNCSGTNPSWTGSFSGTPPQVYDTILFLKQSCPSCYVYPFDDKSSSFTCSNGTTTTNNTQGYTVEFCPNGNGNSNFQPPAH